MLMTLEDVDKRVQAIRDMADDDESAHAAEDRLREDFIMHVAAAHPQLHDMAVKVLSTNDIKFARWYA